MRATRGVVAETLGRLPHRQPATMREVEQALRARLQDAHPAVVAGAAKGLDSLIRNTGKVQASRAGHHQPASRGAATAGSDPL